MARLISDPLTTPGGRTNGPCGALGHPDYVVGMADALQEMMGSPETYATLAGQAHGRVVNFFQLDDVMGAYNRLYKDLGGLESNELEGARDADELVIDLTDGASRRAHPVDPVRAN
jgi:hypothetical protein